MELNEALHQITEIRQQMARTEVFRGYRSATTTFSGAVAVATAVVQSQVLQEPAKHPLGYVLLWVIAAGVSLIVVAAEILVRGRRSTSVLQRDLSVLAIEQFMPCVVSGALLTAVIARFVPEACWMLPGLWAILFGLGVFASCQVLPRQMFWIGGFYLLAGLACLFEEQGTLAISPWAMAVTVGVGHLMSDVILYWSLESSYGRDLVTRAFRVRSAGTRDPREARGWALCRHWRRIPRGCCLTISRACAR